MNFWVEVINLVNLVVTPKIELGIIIEMRIEGESSCELIWRSICDRVP